MLHFVKNTQTHLTRSLNKVSWGHAAASSLQVGLPQDYSVFNVFPVAAISD